MPGSDRPVFLSFGKIDNYLTFRLEADSDLRAHTMNTRLLIEGYDYNTLHSKYEKMVKDIRLDGGESIILNSDSEESADGKVRRVAAYKIIIKKSAAGRAGGCPLTAEDTAKLLSMPAFKALKKAVKDDVKRVFTNTTYKNM